MKLAMGNILLTSMIVVLLGTTWYYLEESEDGVLVLLFSLPVYIPSCIAIYYGKKHIKKIEKYRAKMQQWESEGYDVSELKEVLGDES